MKPRHAAIFGFIAIAATALSALPRLGFCENEAPPRSYVEASGLARHDFRKIKIFSLNPFIGDGIVQQVSLIPSLHALYPGAKIEFETPAAFVLRKSDWLLPEPFSAEDAYQERLPRGVLKPPSTIKFPADLKPLEPLLEDTFDRVLREAGKDNLLIIDPDLTPLLCRMADLQGFARSDLSTKAYLNAVDTAVRSYIVKQAKAHEATVLYTNRIGQPLVTSALPEIAHPGAKQLQALEETYHGMSSGDSNTVYARQQRQLKMIFGPEAELRFPREQMMEGVPDSEYEAFLAGRFSKPDKPTVVVNFNTKAKNKLDALLPEARIGYEAVVSYLTRHFPQLNILVTPPETEALTDESNRRALRKLDARMSSLFGQRRFRGRVAWLPRDQKKLWNNAVERAVLVVSQDSGFVHIANALTDPKKVITFSSDELAAEWRADHQPYVPHLRDFSNGDQFAALTDAINESLRESLGCVAQTERGVLQSLQSGLKMARQKLKTTAGKNR